MNRRHLLRTVAASAGALSLASLTQPIFAGEDRSPGNLFLPLVTSPGASASMIHELLVSPSGALAVTSSNGIQFGSVPNSIFAPLRDIADAIRSSSSEVCQPDLFPAISISDAGPETSLQFGALMAGIPLPLMPLLLLPMHTLNAANSSFDMIVKPDADGLAAPQQFVPLEDVQVLDAGTDAVDGGIKVGNYFIRTSLEKHYLGSCIRRDVWHAGALVKYWPTDRMIFDLHIASWWSGRTPCIGVYESRSGFCRTACATDMWRAIFSVVLAVALVYVTYAVATALASAIATAALGTLVLIPGVPPPP